MTAHHGIRGDRAGEAGEDGVDLGEEGGDAVEHAVAAAVSQSFQPLLSQRRADVAQEICTGWRQLAHRLRRQKPQRLFVQQRHQQRVIALTAAWSMITGTV